MSLRSKALHALALTLLGLQLTAASAEPPHNVILFVPDGLRALMVTPERAPTMAAIRDKGVNFKNPHSLFPTFTTANASAMATGHYLGDTGDFSNTIYTGYPVGPAAGTVTPFLENDAVLFDVDEHFDGKYLNEETILKVARHLQDRVLVEIVAVEVLVDVEQHRVVLQERRHRAGGRADRIAGVDRVADVAGVAEIMAGRHGGGVGGGESGEQRMRVLEIDALVADRRHGRRALRRHHEGAQAVRHEQDHIVRRFGAGRGQLQAEQRQCQGVQRF